MEAVKDIVINLVAAFIGFVIGLVSRKIMFVVKTRQASKFWKRFLRDSAITIVGRITDSRSPTVAGSIDFGDSRAIVELSVFLEKIGFKIPTIIDTFNILGDQIKSNLILIGGPLINNVTLKTLAAKPLSKIQLEIRDGVPGLINKSKNTFYTVVYEKPKKVCKDYGLIISRSNPFAPDKRVLILFGLSGYGTWSAIRFVTSNEFSRDPDRDWVILVESNIVLDTPQDIRIIDGE